MLWARHLHASGYMVTLGLTKSTNENMLIRCGAETHFNVGTYYIMWPII